MIKKVALLAAILSIFSLSLLAEEAVIDVQTNIETLVSEEPKPEVPKTESVALRQASDSAKATTDMQDEREIEIQTETAPEKETSEGVETKAVTPPEKEPVDEIGNIAFVLFTLVGNDLRMEKYDVNELENIESISQKTSRDKHLVLDINLKEKGLTPKSICWDKESPGKMNISAGKKNNLTNYHVQLESLFKDIDHDVMAMCFDCNVKNSKVESKESKWQSHINIELPVKIDDTEINLTLDARVKAACGFFMENDNFEKLINVSGTITKRKALEDGLVTQEEVKEEKPTFNFQDMLVKIKDGAWYLKDRVISLVLLLKQFVGNYWKKNRCCDTV